MRFNTIPWARFALFAGLAHFLLMAAIGLARHWGYLNSINDLGVFDQAIWGTLNGAPFLNTSSAFGVPINWLGFHFNPILLAFVPFYLIYPAAEWLTLFQAAAISITAWPLYLIARRVTQSDRAAFLWALVYLLNPYVLSAAAWDFHPVALAAPLMALGVWAVESRNGKLFLATCLLLLLVQEQFGLSVMGFGALWWLRNRSYWPALLALGMGAAHAILVVGVIMPALSPTGAHVMLSSGSGSLGRYGWLGASAWDALLNVLQHPLLVLKIVLVDMGGAVYLMLLLLPLLGTPLAGLVFLLPGLADLLANLLSANPMPRSVFAYHSITLVPLLVAAGIHGAARLARMAPRLLSSRLNGYTLMASLAFGYLLAPLPLPYAANFWQPRVWIFEREPAVSEIRQLLPPEASVSAQGNVAAHFTQRHAVYPFPAKVGEADFIVLRLDSPTRRLASEKPSMVGTLSHHLMMPPKQYLETVRQLLGDDRYGVAYWNPPWLVFSKREATNEDTARAVNLFLADTEKEWLSVKPYSSWGGSIRSQHMDAE